jgi:hypothetical protein
MILDVLVALRIPHACSLGPREDNWLSELAQAGVDATGRYLFCQFPELRRTERCLSHLLNLLSQLQ